MQSNYTRVVIQLVILAALIAAGSTGQATVCSLDAAPAASLLFPKREGDTVLLAGFLFFSPASWYNQDVIQGGGYDLISVLPGLLVARRIYSPQI